MAQGFYVTESDVKSSLQDMNKTQEGYNVWRQMYGAIDLAKQKDLSGITYDYEKDLAETYAQAYAAKQNMENSSYFDSYKNQYITDVDKSLEEAYNSYISNYFSNVNKLDTEYNKLTSDVTGALKTEAKQYSEIINKIPDYLKYMYESAYSNEDVRKNIESQLGYDFWKNPAYERLLTEEGTLKDWETLSYLGEFTTDDEGNKTYTVDPFFAKDEQGNDVLTKAGKSFYDSILNNPLYSYGVQSFDTWLKGENEDLYNWYTSYNPYNYAPNMAGVTTGSSNIRQFLGMRSDDYKYNFIEDFAGMTKTQLENKLNVFKDRLESLSTNYRKDASKIASSSVEVFNEIRDWSNTLGLSQEFNDYLNQQGTSWDELSNELTKVAEKIKDNGELTLDFFKGLTTPVQYALAPMMATGGIAAGSAAAAATGIAGGAGAAAASTGVGALVIGGIALAAGIGLGSTKVSESKDYNEWASKSIKEGTLNYVTSLSQYAEARRANVVEGKPMDYSYTPYIYQSFEDWKKINNSLPAKDRLTANDGTVFESERQKHLYNSYLLSKKYGYDKTFDDWKNESFETKVNGKTKYLSYDNTELDSKYLREMYNRYLMKKEYGYTKSFEEFLKGK